jgi:hypothetical protein
VIAVASKAAGVGRSIPAFPFRSPGNAGKALGLSRTKVMDLIRRERHSVAHAAQTQ